MEIEQDYNNNNIPMEQEESKANIYNNNFSSNNNIYKNFFFINKGKFTKKRNYNESVNSYNKVYIKEKELKFLLKLANQIKIKLDSSNNFTEPKKEEKNNNKEKVDIKFENVKFDFKIDYSTIDLNYINLELFKSNNLSDELKRFILKKLVDNAIKVEKIFQNYFNINNMPNKK